MIRATRQSIASSVSTGSTHHPGNRAFYHVSAGSTHRPTLRNDRTSPVSKRLLNDIEPYGGMLREPPIKPRFLPFINPNLLHPRKGVMAFGQEPFGSFCVQDMGRMYQNSHEETIRINPALTLAPVDLLSHVIATLAANFRRFR
ncbi:MAG: hypothetical protein NZL98_03135 [Anaerolineales bacterium]|nr:hypothetical protein [Anaerolineales bacterium]